MEKAKSISDAIEFLEKIKNWHDSKDSKVTVSININALLDTVENENGWDESTSFGDLIDIQIIRTRYKSRK